MENKKIESDNKQIQKLINEASDKTIRAENINKEFEHQGDIYGKGIKQIGEADPEIQKMTFWADLELHRKFIEKLNKQEVALDEKIADLKRSQNVINTLEPLIAKLQEKIKSGGILPVKKEELKRQLEGLEKIQGEMRRVANLELNEIESVGSREYKKPKSPGENIIKN